VRWKLQDTGVLVALAALGSYIWIHDGRWQESASDTLPLLAALPLFVWLRGPWRSRVEPGPALSPRPLLGAAGCLMAGGALDVTFLLAAGWTLLLWSWIDARFYDGSAVGARRPALSVTSPPEPAGGASFKLLVLPLLAFPWLANDLPQLGWWFRLSGAAAAGRVLSVAHFAVERSGTFLVVNGFPASVEPACSGLNGLQAMLVAGTMVAFVQLGRSRLFWLCLPLFVVAAWLANVARIAGAAALGASLAPDIAAARVAQYHTLGGWIALIVMFAISALITSGMARWSNRPRQHRGPLPSKWLELVVIGTCAWRCRDLLSTWFNSPYDRWGWLAFALWLLPLTLWAARGAAMFGAGEHRVWFAAVGLIVACLGSAVQLNVLEHAGFTLVWLALMPKAGRALWAVTAVAWWPAFGWASASIGLGPTVTAALRVVLAGAGAIGAARAQRKGTAENLLHVDGNKPVLRDAI
jgi:exosortase/archaeosortase family protein